MKNVNWLFFNILLGVIIALEQDYETISTAYRPYQLYVILCTSMAKIVIILGLNDKFTVKTDIQWFGVKSFFLQSLANYKS